MGQGFYGVLEISVSAWSDRIAAAESQSCFSEGPKRLFPSRKDIDGFEVIFAFGPGDKARGNFDSRYEIGKQSANVGV
jgi:hypothetical protein